MSQLGPTTPIARSGPTASNDGRGTSSRASSDPSTSFGEMFDVALGRTGARDAGSAPADAVDRGDRRRERTTVRSNRDRQSPEPRAARTHDEHDRSDRDDAARRTDSTPSADRAASPITPVVGPLTDRTVDRVSSGADVPGTGDAPTSVAPADTTSASGTAPSARPGTSADAPAPVDQVRPAPAGSHAAPTGTLDVDTTTGPTGPTGPTVDVDPSAGTVPIARHTAASPDSPIPSGPPAPPLSDDPSAATITSGSLAPPPAAVTSDSTAPSAPTPSAPIPVGGHETPSSPDRTRTAAGEPSLPADSLEPSVRHPESDTSAVPHDVTASATDTGDDAVRPTRVGAETEPPVDHEIDADVESTSTVDTATTPTGDAAGVGDADASAGDPGSTDGRRDDSPVRDETAVEPVTLVDDAGAVEVPDPSDVIDLPTHDVRTDQNQTSGRDTSTAAVASRPSTAAGAPTPSAPRSTATTSSAAWSSDEVPDLLGKAELNRLTSGGTRLGIDMTTTELGSIRVEAHRRDGTLHVDLRSEHAGTRSVLAEHVDDLRRELRDGGLDLDSVDVRTADRGHDPTSSRRHGRHPSAPARPVEHEASLRHPVDVLPTRPRPSSPPTTGFDARI